MRFRETVIVSGGLMTQQLTVFGTGVLIARHLGASGFGELGTLKSLSTFLLIVTPLGLDLALLKHASFFSKRPSELGQISGALRLLVAALNLIILALVATLVGPKLQAVYQDIPNFSRLCGITMLGLVFAADVQISGALYRVADKVTQYALIVNFSQPIARLAASYMVLVLGGGVESIAWVNSVMFIYAFAVIAYADRRSRVRMPPLDIAAVASRIRGILSESLWMALLLLVYQAMRFVDILVLAALTNPKVTGEYTAMSNVAQLIQIYPSAISQTLGPRIATLYQANDMPGINDELQGYLRKASMLGGFLFGGIAVFGTDLDLIFGKAFDFPPALAVLLASGWYVSASLAPLGYVLSMTGRHRQELAVLSVGAILLVVCLMLFIPPLGSIGAALAVMIAFVTVNVLRCIYVVRVLSFNPLRLRDFAPPACFAFVALACSVAGFSLAGKQLAAFLAECLVYLLLSAACYLGFFATEPEKGMIRARLAASGYSR